MNEEIGIIDYTHTLTGDKLKEQLEKIKNWRPETDIYAGVRSKTITALVSEGAIVCSKCSSSLMHISGETECDYDRWICINNKCDYELE